MGGWVAQFGEPMGAVWTKLTILLEGPLKGFFFCSHLHRLKLETFPYFPLTPFLGAVLFLLQR